MIVHKNNTREKDPFVSIILLDWECRELFFALDWLNRMDGDRSRFEVIWVELYNRVVPEAMEKCDVVITLGQEGRYHKHKAYNVGLLEARGKIITVCDSDAVFQPNFIDSILESFGIPDGAGEPKSMVLMHHEYRSPEQYPAELTGFDQLKEYPWEELWPNVGACLSVSAFDAIRFGGFDEHSSYQGYMCGPYDLGWRMVNACIPEMWYDEHKCALWHFAHPDPTGTYMPFSLRLWREIAHPHIKGHALTAVDAFSSGRTMPLKENEKVHETRLSLRRIGCEFEAEYAAMTGPDGFSLQQRAGLFLKMCFGIVWKLILVFFRKCFSRLPRRLNIRGLGIRTKLKRLFGNNR